MKFLHCTWNNCSDIQSRLAQSTITAAVRQNSPFQNSSVCHGDSETCIKEEKQSTAPLNAGIQAMRQIRGWSQTSGRGRTPRGRQLLHAYPNHMWFAHHWLPVPQMNEPTHSCWWTDRKPGAVIWKTWRICDSNFSTCKGPNMEHTACCFLTATPGLTKDVSLPSNSTTQPTVTGSASRSPSADGSAAHCFGQAYEPRFTFSLRYSFPLNHAPSSHP